MQARLYAVGLVLAKEEKAMAVKGIDVSKWQGEVDFRKVKADGYDFVIISAGYGMYSWQKDSYFETNYKNAKAAGLGVGAYWYSYAGRWRVRYLTIRCVSILRTVRRQGFHGRSSGR